MNYFVGIDLGTTNSTVSVIELSNPMSHPIKQLKRMPIFQYDKNQNANLNAYQLPSYLYFDIDHQIVYTGEYAKAQYAAGSRPLQTIQGIKMRMGGESIAEIPSLLNRDNTAVYTMTQCSAFYLKTIRESLRKQLQTDAMEAVITIPTAFNYEERLETINAAKLAGFQEVHLLDEPTAALYWHVHDEDADLEHHLREKPQNVLVYDIGGGTLDISVAHVDLVTDTQTKEERIHVEILGCSPRMDLGGNDFDRLLGSYFLYDFERGRKDLDERSAEQQSRMIARIVSEAETQKIIFNEKIQRYLDRPHRRDTQELTVNFEVANNQNLFTVLSYDILRQVFSQYTDPYGKKTLTSAIAPALQKAKLQVSDIDEVIITGGMSQFYLIEETLRKYFDGSGVRFCFMDHISSVSKGAAIYHYSIHSSKDGTFNHNTLKKLIVQDKVAENIYVRNGRSYKVMIPHTAQPNSSGVVQYEIQEEGLIEIPLFLYSGHGDDPLTYTPLDGKFIHLKKSMAIGDVIPIHWHIDHQKIIHLEIIGMDHMSINGMIHTISDEAARQDPVHQLQLNGAIFKD